MLEAWAGDQTAAENQEDVLALGHLGQELDPLFRMQTTQNYLQMQGFKGDAQTLLDFDFASMLQRQDILAAVDAMIVAIGL